MRVITGTARGRVLKELMGMETRPTTGKVKESLFSIIQFDIEGRRVLDLFAGTGQLGIEALSRGAAECVFVERRSDAVHLVQENLALCKLTDRAHVRQGDALAYLRSGEKFDLIFLDPPYASGLLEQTLTDIAAFDICRQHGIIVAESAVETVLPALPPPYQLYREYRYGKIKLVNCEKKLPMFTPERRLELIRRSVADIPNVEVENWSGLLADYAREKGAHILLKGVRNATDWDMELQMSRINQGILPGLETLLLPASADYEHFSSTMAREMIRYGQPLEKYVPAPIAEELEKMRG